MRYLVAIFLLWAGAAVAQPTCSPAAPGAIACLSPAVTPLLSDIVWAQQATGPNRSNQTVKLSLAQIVAMANLPGAFASPPVGVGSIAPTSGAFTTLSSAGSILLPSSIGPEGAPTSPYNQMLYTSDQFASTTGPVSTLLIRNNFGGGSTNGGRNTVLITSQLVGSIGTYNQNYVGQQIIMKDAGNVTGATSGAPLGSFFGLGVNLQIAAGSFAYGATGAEFDYTQATGSTVKYMEFMKFADFSPAGVTATVNSAFLRFESVNQTMNMGLTFGDPQAAGNGFPVNSTGTLIYSYAGSAGVGIDMSLDTFATAFIKGPNSFQVDNTSDVHTRQIWANTTSFPILAANGSPYFAATGPVSPNTYLQAIAGASVQPILQGVGHATMTFKTGGTAGQFQFWDSTNYPALIVQNVASPANYLTVSGAVTTSPVLLTATGSDANIDINLVPKGAGVFKVNGIAVSATPTISSGFGTTPTAPPAGETSNFFQITVGTGGTANSGVVAFSPAAAHGWSCRVNDDTNSANINVKSVSTSTSSATFAAYSATTGLATAFSAGDVLTASCSGG